MSRVFLTLGAVNAFLCVALGAFGAHGLKQRLSTDMLAVYQTGVQYHFYHALGLIAVGLILLHLPASRLLTLSGWLMLAGIILFSVSLVCPEPDGNTRARYNHAIWRRRVLERVGDAWLWGVDCEINSTKSQ